MNSRDHSGKLDPIRYSQFKAGNSPDKSFRMRLSRWGFSKFKAFLSTLVLIFAVLLWMGAQVDSETRKTAIIKGFHFVPQGLHEFSVDYVLGVLDCAYEAIEGTKNAVFLWSKVGLMIGGPLVQVSVALFYVFGSALQVLWPYFIACWGLFVDFLVYLQPIAIIILQHLKVGTENGVKMFFEQDGINIFLELLTPVVIILMWFFKNWLIRQNYPSRIRRQYEGVRKAIQTRYRSLVLSIQQQSRVAAAFLPHVILAIPILGSVMFLPSLLASISRGYILLIVSLLYPEFCSVMAIEEKKEGDRIRQLTYWTIFSVVSFVSSTVEYIPFMSRFLPLPLVSEISFCFFIWLQLPWTDGAALTYKAFIPVLNTLIATIPKPAWLIPAKEGDERSWIIKILIGLLPEQYRSKATSFVFQSGYLVFALVFFMTPAYFTGLGCIFVGIGLPYFSSINALREGGGKDAKDEQVWWLTYWVSYFIFSSTHDLVTNLFGMEHFPFWYQIKLAVVMWLQIPLFQGAQNVYDRGILVVYNTLMNLFTFAISFTPLTPRRPANPIAEMPSSPSLLNAPIPEESEESEDDTAEDPRLGLKVAQRDAEPISAPAKQALKPQKLDFSEMKSDIKNEPPLSPTKSDSGLVKSESRVQRNIREIEERKQLEGQT